MPKIRDILVHVSVEQAQRQRKCRRHNTHKVNKGDMCLVIITNDTNDNYSYCIEAAKPIPMVELGKQPSSIHVWAICYNLGQHPFVIDKLIVSIVHGSRRISSLVGPFVVTPGARVPVQVDMSELLSDDKTLRFAMITFMLKSASGMIQTDPVWLNFSTSEAGGYFWSTGGPDDRQPGTIVEPPRELPDRSELL